MAQITVTTEGTSLSGNEHQVEWVATSALEMPTEIFIYKYSTREFSHVAVGADLEYPLTPTPAKGFYRQASAIEVFESLEKAEKAKVNIATAIQELVAEFNADLSSFNSIISTTYT